MRTSEFIDYRWVTRLSALCMYALLMWYAPPAVSQSISQSVSQLLTTYSHIVSFTHISFHLLTYRFIYSHIVSFTHISCVLFVLWRRSVPMQPPPLAQLWVKTSNVGCGRCDKSYAAQRIRIRRVRWHVWNSILSASASTCVCVDALSALHRRAPCRSSLRTYVPPYHSYNPVSIHMHVLAWLSLAFVPWKQKWHGTLRWPF